MTPQYPDSSYAFWTDPRTGFTVTYSIALFNELSAEAEKGFNKIKYGGVEIGGVLLGVPGENGVRVEGYRPIACQYAFGPRFILSEPDVEGLKSTLETLAADEQVQPVGFFVSHTRSSLQLSDSEMDLAEEFFQGAGKFAVLIQPQLDAAPLFSFLTRGDDGEIELDGHAIAIRVPIPEEGAVATAEEPLASIASPVEAPVSEVVEQEEEAEVEDEEPGLADEPELEEVAAEDDEFDVVEAEVVDVEYVEPEVSEEQEVEEAGPEQPVEVEPKAVEPEEVKPEPVSAIPVEAQPELVPQQAPQPELDAVAEPVPETKAAPESIKLEEVKPTEVKPEEVKPAAVKVEEPEAKPKPVEPEQKAAREQVPPAEKPGFEFKPVGYEEEKDIRDQHREAAKKFQFSKFRWAAVLAAAVLLGSSAGYWIYSQLPPTTIPLRAQAQPPILTLSWPAESTRDAVWAGIRIDNGQPITLSTSDKLKGQAQINVPSDNVKVELIAQHWMRDSRGIVRFINGMTPQTSASTAH